NSHARCTRMWTLTASATRPMLSAMLLDDLADFVNRHRLCGQLNLAAREVRPSERSVNLLFQHLVSRRHYRLQDLVEGCAKAGADSGQMRGSVRRGSPLFKEEELTRLPDTPVDHKVQATLALGVCQGHYVFRD